MAIVVTGGAGYMGSMLCKTLVTHGEEVVVIDNLSGGQREPVVRVGAAATYYEADIHDADAIAMIIADVRPERVRDGRTKATSVFTHATS